MQFKREHTGKFIFKMLPEKLMTKAVTVFFFKS